MSIEAMKQALKALEESGLRWPNIIEAITSLRQAIAEASENGLYREGYRNGYGFGEAAGKRHARQTWVGLTDEEIQEIALELPMDAVRITEAKLKEKNT